MQLVQHNALTLILSAVTRGLHLVCVKVRYVTVSLRRHCLWFLDSLDACLVSEYVRFAAGQMLDEFVGGIGQLTYDQILAGSYMKQSSLYFAPHEAVFELIV